MRLIAGLGNPGNKYAETRHNVGWQFLDHLVRSYGAPPFASKSKFEAEVTDLTLNGTKITLLKPQTYMNNSGRAVYKWVTFHETHHADVVVVHDDLDIALGDFKVQRGIGPKAHNGISSVEQYLGSQDFMRVRIGVDSRTPEEREHIPGSDYVLRALTEEERGILNEVFQRIQLF